MARNEGSRWLLIFGAYFGLQAALRAAFGTSLNWDEAEALYFARHLAWGYGPQPPLYFWLQWGAFQLFGPTVLALAVLKNLMLAGFATLVFLVLRREVGPREAGVAALSLGLLVALSWEGQRALTHTALALFVAAATLWLAIRALERGGWRDHLALGVAVGFGALSKLNFLVWAVGPLVAAALLPEWRRRLKPWRVLGAAALAIAMNLPALAWMLRNPEAASVGFEKMEFAVGGALEARLQGTVSLILAVLNFLAPPILVLGGAWLMARARPARLGIPLDLPPGVRLAGFAAVVGLGLLWGTVLATGSTRIDYMWLLVPAWSLVPVTVLTLWPRFGRGSRRALVGASAATWIVALVGLPVAGLLAPTSTNRWLDYGPAAARLVELQGTGLPVVASFLPVSGNLVLREPGLEIVLLTTAEPETVAASDLPPERTVFVAPADDMLLSDPEVLRRTESVELFDSLPQSRARRIAIVYLAPR